MMAIIVSLMVVCISLMFTTAYYMDRYNQLAKDLEISIIDQYINLDPCTDYQNGWNQATNNVLFILNRLKKGGRYE